MVWNKHNLKLNGYSTVFLLCILSSFMLAALLILEAASGFAARSVADNICAVAGRSILSEFQTNLYERYGLFALRNSEDFAMEKAEFYISKSFDIKQSVVHLRINEVSIDMGLYSMADYSEIERQIKALNPLGLDSYFQSALSRKFESKDNTKLKYELEYIIAGKESDEENEKAIKDRIYASRFAADLAAIYADDAEIAELRVLSQLVLPGVAGEVAVFTLASARAAEQAKEETEKIMNNESVPVLNIEGVSSCGNYNDYLNLFLKLVSKKNKIKRFTEIVEMNIREIDGADFSFGDYVYGFEMEVSLSKKVFSVLWGSDCRRRLFKREFCYN